MLTTDMVAVLCCPACQQSGLRAEIKSQAGSSIEAGSLICGRCGACYAVEAGVPMLVPQAALRAADWQLWQAHLQGFHARRAQREKTALRLRPGRRRRSHQAFFDFARITEGAVLDVGCGPGKLRAYLDPERVTYYGVDPLPTPEAREFRYACALAEHLPFHASTFSHLMVVSALDHFKDLGRFFAEARRVLKPGGRLHLMQAVHDGHSPRAAIKELVHVAKDVYEGALSRRPSKAPKHMNNFGEHSLLQLARDYFEQVAVAEYTPAWYTYRVLFISLSPLPPREPSFAVSQSDRGQSMGH